MQLFPLLENQHVGITQLKSYHIASLLFFCTYYTHSGENIKSRPSYAPTYERDREEKARQRRFFESGRYRIYLPDYEIYTSAQVARMVHLERVKMDPYETASSGNQIAWEGYLLYDYQRVDPVTHDAFCRKIPLEVFEER